MKQEIFSFYNTQSSRDKRLQHELEEHPLFKQIIETPAFQRLNSISFLGAIDKYHFQPKRQSNRFHHSLDVAKLALHVCQNRNYDKETTELIVSAALLHDIGHAPLSHSMEKTFQKHFDLNHHIVGEMVIRGDDNKFKKLSNLLANRLDVESMLMLISQKSNEEFGDIFSSPINVDTIDGIHRSLKFNQPNHSMFDKYRVVEASLLNTNTEKREAILDNFWICKSFVYKYLINSGIGALKDHFSREFFENNLSYFHPGHFTSTEQSLFNNRSPIFSKFKDKVESVSLFVGASEHHNMTSHSDEESLDILEIDIVQRHFTIDHSVEVNQKNNSRDLIKKRYTYKKERNSTSIYYSSDISGQFSISLDFLSPK